ncbi:MAG: hypothetical protein C4575_01015 [Desulforudis sp.]|jgi:hypothetical protein|nr:hypothetical protein [Clostridia bacterium]MDQ7790831.1 hypothetical protein [Clostridia bacterium]RJX22685.1 MAG: hypothetical protein C4575_01015 [Desulforudis sp.]
MVTAIVFFAILGLFFLVRWYDREKRGSFMTWHRSGNLWELEPQKTPFSEALGTLIGNAGGIYLSVVLMLTFVGIEPPARITVGTMELEPLASAAILLAAIQPVLLGLTQGIRKRARF